MDTPLLLLIWRRPNTLKQVIDAIRPVAPTNLFVACDGPNYTRPEEVLKVAATRELISDYIDWPCELKMLYSDINQGCRLGVSRAISWFFDHVDEGIILEDDCVPHPDFFLFCNNLLSYYRSDTRVSCISGNNFYDGDWIGNGDYFFGQIPMCWGWATWKSRWLQYDSDLRLWPLFNKLNLLNSVFPDPAMRSYWSDIWATLYCHSKPDSWAYRWAFTCVMNGGLTALPKINLVSNIGFGDDACHTSQVCASRPTHRLPSSSINHPQFIISHHHNNKLIFDNHFGGKWRRFPFNHVRIVFKFVRSVFFST